MLSGLYSSNFPLNSSSSSYNGSSSSSPSKGDLYSSSSSSSSTSSVSASSVITISAVIPPFSSDSARISCTSRDGELPVLARFISIVAKEEDALEVTVPDRCMSFSSRDGLLGSFLILIAWCDLGDEKASGDINVILSAASCSLSEGVPVKFKLLISAPLFGVFTLLLLVLIFKSSVTLMLVKGLADGSCFIFARGGISVISEELAVLGVVASFFTIPMFGDLSEDSSGVCEIELLLCPSVLIFISTLAARPSGLRGTCDVNASSYKMRHSCNDFG